MGSDACQETVRDPKDNIESGGGEGGGGGGGVFGSLLVYKLSQGEGEGYLVVCLSTS